MVISSPPLARSQLLKCNQIQNVNIHSSRSLSASFMIKSNEFLVNPRKLSSNVKSMFWYPERQKSVIPATKSFTILADQSIQKENAESSVKKKERNSSEKSEPISISISVVSSLTLIDAEEWNACAMDASGENAANPFLYHAFLLSLEESQSAVEDEGWLPQHLVAKSDSGKVMGVVPLYLKNHSYGEYVFDHAWASAYSRFGQSYYPKLQCCVPFTPATGARILVRQTEFSDVVFSSLCKAIKTLTDEYGISSAHVTFPNQEDMNKLTSEGFLKRVGIQYHWFNQNYKTFDEFLMDLKAGKRKNIRQERKRVIAQDLKLLRLRGDDIKPRHWDAFYEFYRNTTDNKWGQAYLTREFFHLIGERMGKDVLLVMAEKDEKLVAGALNLIGQNTLFGRNWGCIRNAHFPHLHFEACYYQAIEAAIEWGLDKVEAGAQGDHKIQRGYKPTATFSAHYIRDPDFRSAVMSFLRRETFQVESALTMIDEVANPFKEVSFSGSDTDS